MPEVESTRQRGLVVMEVAKTGGPCHFAAFRLANLRMRHSDLETERMLQY